MKRILALLLALCMLLALTACGEDAEGTPAGDGTGTSNNITEDGTEDGTEDDTEDVVEGDTNDTIDDTEDDTKNGTEDGTEDDNDILTTSCNHNWIDANCVAPKTCKNCNLTDGDPVNIHDWRVGDCIMPMTCFLCGATQGEAPGHDWGTASVGFYMFCRNVNCNEKYTCACGYSCDICNEFNLCRHYFDHWKTHKGGCPHEYKSDTNSIHHMIRCQFCDDIQSIEKHTWVSYEGGGYRCTGCALYTSNPPAIDPNVCDHSWNIATCTFPKFCIKCGMSMGNALGHSWNDTTCTSPKTCRTCGAIEGSAAGHSWNAATCTAPKICKTCGATKGSAAGHSWKAATCTAPKTCKTCGATDGSAVGHSWSAATCTTPKTCKTCGATEGTANGHKWLDGKCEVCSTIRTEYTTEKFLDELEGVSFTYVGITYDPYGSSKGFSIWFQVVNSTDEMVCVHTGSVKVNGHSCFTSMYDYIAPNTTQTVDLYVAASDSTLSPTLNDYGEDIVRYVEFNFQVTFPDRESNKYFASTKNIKLYPYA